MALRIYSVTIESKVRTARDAEKWVCTPWHNIVVIDWHETDVSPRSWAPIRLPALLHPFYNHSFLHSVPFLVVRSLTRRWVCNAVSTWQPPQQDTFCVPPPSYFRNIWFHFIAMDIEHVEHRQFHSQDMRNDRRTRKLPAGYQGRWKHGEPVTSSLFHCGCRG